MKDGFIRCGCAVPDLKVADCEYNAEQIINAVKEAAANGCSLLTLPELCITGYTCGDLFLSKVLLDGAEKALFHILEETKDLEIIFIAGLPLSYSGKLYNCAAICLKGRVLGFVPKRNIPNYSEFYEARHFTPWDGGNSLVSIPRFNTRMGEMLFGSYDDPDFVFGVEICEDLWVPSSPSEELALNGALIICNPSASDEVIGKKEYRRKLVEMQSAKLVCGYVYTDCGFGESTQDMIFSGHSLICENGTRLTESKPFSNGIIYGDIDLEKLAGERRRMNTYPGTSGDNTIDVR
ncbi:MAG: NAD(+) synthase, partial [Oscillospiraceae bacterium]|nr:NAD(+) synthase [Oscillospiraceae bacterium]